MSLYVDDPQFCLLQSLFDLFDEPPELAFVSVLFSGIELREKTVEHPPKAPRFNRHAYHRITHGIADRGVLFSVRHMRFPFVLEALASPPFISDPNSSSTSKNKQRAIDANSVFHQQLSCLPSK
jgi:hypothetical protein